jgi:hypothetical protein
MWCFGIRDRGHSYLLVIGSILKNWSLRGEIWRETAGWKHAQIHGGFGFRDLELFGEDGLWFLLSTKFLVYLRKVLTNPFATINFKNYKK